MAIFVGTSTIVVRYTRSNLFAATAKIKVTVKTSAAIVIHFTWIFNCALTFVGGKVAFLEQHTAIIINAADDGSTFLCLHVAILASLAVIINLAIGRFDAHTLAKKEVALFTRQAIKIVHATRIATARTSIAKLAHHAVIGFNAFYT